MSAVIGVFRDRELSYLLLDRTNSAPHTCNFMTEKLLTDAFSNEVPRPVLAPCYARETTVTCRQGADVGVLCLPVVERLHALGVALDVLAAVVREAPAALGPSGELPAAVAWLHARGVGAP